MGNKKIGLGLMLNLIGAMFAYLIGSGFASGQETMQYFSGWGSVWTSLGVAVIALLLSCLAYIAYSYAGRTRGLKDLAGIYDFYAGNVFGKLFQVFAWLFNACCYMFMISGFGNVFHQQWGISIPIAFPLLKYLRNCISCFKFPKEPSACILRFVLKRIPSSESIRSKPSFLCFRNVFAT